MCVTEQAGADGTEPSICQPTADWPAVSPGLLSTTIAQVSATQQLARLPAVCQITPTGWWSGVVVSVLASINEVNQRRAQLGDRVWVQFPVLDIYFSI